MGELIQLFPRGHEKSPPSRRPSPRLLEKVSREYPVVVSKTPRVDKDLRRVAGHLTVD